MSKIFKTPKVVADPIYGIVDIRLVLAMVEAKEFQALGDKRQLGMAYLTFPSATHTRKAHSLGSYHATRQLAERWIKLGFINKKEGDALAGYALYHDIGHPAFSHVTEPLIPIKIASHDMSVNAALSLEIIRKRKKEIEACGIDFKLMESMASYKNPLYAAVSDKNIGMEKLDYLERDGMSTILGRPVGMEYLRHHIYFVQNRLAIDEKVVDNAIEAQSFYLKMYKNVYLRKTSVIAQGMLQKMTSRLIAAGEIAVDDLIDLTDSELLGMMRLSKDETVQTMYERLRKRDLYREAILIRPERFARAETQFQKEKGIAVFGVRPAGIKHLMERSYDFSVLGESIAAMAGIPADAVLIIPIVGASRFFDAKDVLIYQGNGKPLASMKDRYPAHFKNTEEVAEDYLTFRICATQEYRKKLSAPGVAKKIFELLMK